MIIKLRLRPAGLERYLFSIPVTRNLPLVRNPPRIAACAEETAITQILGEFRYSFIRSCEFELGLNSGEMA